MGERTLGYELIERKNNFYGNFNPLTIHNERFYAKLHNLCEMINVEINESEMDSNRILEIIFFRIYHFVISCSNHYKILCNDILIYTDVFNACFFTTLCMFLYDTKRIKGLSLRKFIYTHSSLNYNIKGSTNYFDYSNTPREGPKTKSIISEDAKLRKYRHRFLSERPSYSDSTEWSAIRKVSEHEWSLYYLLGDADPNIVDTFKRIKNLYHGIYEALHSPIDIGYKNRLETAYDKFSSKLEKLKYENVLKLDKYILEHICKDKTCYGINLYRFEKELRLYTIMDDINQLLRCNGDNDEEAYILDKSMIMNEIFYPKLYQSFGKLKDLDMIKVYTHTFCLFRDELVVSCCLALDKFIECGSLGENWEDLLLKTLNNMAEDIFYNPEEINYITTAESETMFFYEMAIPVCKEIERSIILSQHMQLSLSDTDEDEI